MIKRIEVGRHIVSFIDSHGTRIDLPKIYLTQYSAIAVTGPHSVVEKAYIADYCILIDNVSNQPHPELKKLDITLHDVKEAAKKAGLTMLNAVKDDGLGRLKELLVTNAPINKTVKGFVLKGMRYVGSAPFAVITGVFFDAKSTGKGADLDVREFTYRLRSGESVFVAVRW